MVKVITDMRILKPLIKKYGIVIDKEHRYVLNDISLNNSREMRKEGYSIEYVSGSFYPYVTKL